MRDSACQPMLCLGISRASMFSCVLCIKNELKEYESVVSTDKPGSKRISSTTEQNWYRY